MPSTTNPAPSPIYDGEAAQLLAQLAPLDALDLRYLRKSTRFVLGLRKTYPARFFDAGSIGRERADLLDRLAQWLVQEYQ